MKNTHEEIIRKWKDSGLLDDIIRSWKDSGWLDDIKGSGDENLVKILKRYNELPDVIPMIKKDNK